MSSSSSLLPHQHMLSIPPSLHQHKRRTIPIDLQTHSKKTKCSLTDNLYIREINIAVGGLGCSTWDGSIILARWIKKHSHLFKNKIVCELGAGTGVPSLIASRSAKKMIVTEYIDELLENIEYNLKINSNIEDMDDVTVHAHAHSMNNGMNDTSDDDIKQRLIQERMNMKHSISTVYFDWHILEDVYTDDEWSDNDDDDDNYEHTHGMRVKTSQQQAADHNNTIDLTHEEEDHSDEINQHHTSGGHHPPHITSTNHLSRRNDPLNIISHDDRENHSTSNHFVDIMIGSELMYTPNPTHRYALMRVLQRYLRDDGTGVFYCVQSINREGMKEFIELLQSHGFHVTFQYITESEPCSGLLGEYNHSNDRGRGIGFVQREEQYLFYTIRKLSEDERQKLKREEQQDVVHQSALTHHTTDTHQPVDHQHCDDISTYHHKAPSTSSSTSTILPDVQYIYDSRVIENGGDNVMKEIIRPKPTNVR